MLYVLLVLSVFPLAGCPFGSATAAYSLNSKSADDLSANARKSVIEEAVSKSKEYCDANFVKKESIESVKR